MTVNTSQVMVKFVHVLAQTLFEAELHFPEGPRPVPQQVADLLGRQIEAYVQHHPEMPVDDQVYLRELKNMLVELLLDQEMRGMWS